MTNIPRLFGVSRREFARRVAITTAVAATSLAVPEGLRGQTSVPASVAAPQPPGVTPEVAAEVETKFNEVLRLHGPKFTPQQKEEIRRQIISQVQGVQKLRAYALDNADAPATVLHLSGTEGK
jgi:hypothetical protein